ncbi:hypothetical protein J6590_003236 [Homalodisca vitripennis]|nr:hypothetical protein J6590_003236 [Homalodisca vitripennis]
MLGPSISKISPGRASRPTASMGGGFPYPRFPGVPDTPQRRFLGAPQSQVQRLEFEASHGHLSEQKNFRKKRHKINSVCHFNIIEMILFRYQIDHDSRSHESNL